MKGLKNNITPDFKKQLVELFDVCVLVLILLSLNVVPIDIISHIVKSFGGNRKTRPNIDKVLQEIFAALGLQPL